MVQRFLLMRGSCPCFVTFRVLWEQNGSRNLALPGHRHARGSGHECLATDDVTRTLGAIGASGPGCGCQQGAWVSTDATERFLLARENVLPNSTPLNDPTNAVPTNAATS